jgi:hypothetical protein
MCLEEAAFTVERISNDQLNAKHSHSLFLLYLLYGIWSANNQHLPLGQGQQSMNFGNECHKYSQSSSYLIDIVVIYESSGKSFDWILCQV